jgi:HK97 family phage major capsid protein
MDPVIVAAEAASELVQAMQLRSIAESHGKGREAEEILTSGKTLAEARGLIMGLLATTPLSTTAPSLESMGASKREQEDFRYGRLLEGAISLREGRSASGFELEVSQTIARGMPPTYKARGGVFAPFAIRSAAMDSKTAGAGKEFVYTQQGEFIDILRAKLFLTKLGARFMTGLTGPIGFSKQTGAAIANWVDENGGVDAADSAAATGIVTLSPKSLIGIGKISRQLLTVGSWDAELMIRQDLAYSHAAALELAAIHGTGGTQPTGIYNLSGVNVVAMGGNPTYAKAVDMLTEIAVDNALGGSIGWATTPRVVGKLLQTLEFAASGAKSAWTGTYEDGYLAGYKGTSSGLIKTNLGAGTNEQGMVAGDFSSMICGLFGNGFELIPDHLTLAAQGLVKVNSFGMADVVCRYAESFCKATGVILT